MNNSLKQSKIKLEDYYKKLLNADWFYHCSDCFETRERARNNIEMLKKIGKSHPIASKMWNDCQEYVRKLWNDSNTEVFNCPKINAEFSF